MCKLGLLLNDQAPPLPCAPFYQSMVVGIAKTVVFLLGASHEAFITKPPRIEAVWNEKLTCDALTAHIMNGRL